MNRKTEESYQGVLREIVTNVCSESLNNAKVVMADFELGIMNAAAAAWPNARIMGCFFHFAQVRSILYNCVYSIYCKLCSYAFIGPTGLFPTRSMY